MFSCDEGYSGEYCVPSYPLPMMLRDDFNRKEAVNENWLEVHGGEPAKMCGILVSGNALTFSDVSGFFMSATIRKYDGIKLKQ